MATKKPSLKSIIEAGQQYRSKALAFINELRYPTRRPLLSITAADNEGKLNAITAAELVTIVHLTGNTDERVYVEAGDKQITFWAERNKPIGIPVELS